MVVYELYHLFFCCNSELVYSPKKLGLYYSYEIANNAMAHYIDQPGFSKSQDAFSIRERIVSGNIVNDKVFEALIYFHTADYEIEFEIELGLYGDENLAKREIAKYCKNNTTLVNSQSIICEKILDTYIINKREWEEGFSI